MNRTFVAVCGAVVLSVALVGAQAHPAGDAKSAPGKNDKKDNKNGANPNAVTFTGCLNPGSNGDTFYLTNVKQKGAKSADKTLKLVAAKTDKKVSLGTFVTNEVEITGSFDEPNAAPDAAESGQARTVTVTKVKFREQYCG
jgi:hypothetical protein